MHEERQDPTHTKAEQVQWWLAELDRYGNPTLVDGAHSDRSGVDRAMEIFMEVGSRGKSTLTRGKRFAIARVELTEIER